MNNSGNTQTEYVGYEIDIESVLDEVLEKEGAGRPFFVVGKAFEYLKIEERIREKYPHAVFFKDFLPNPTYESVM